MASQRTFAALLLAPLFAACSAGTGTPSAPPSSGPVAATTSLARAASCEDLRGRIQQADGEGRGYMMMEDMAVGMPKASNGAITGAIPDAMPAAPSGQGVARDRSSDFSTTNVQVEGVDEADSVKTDGEFIYVLVDNTLQIVRALPANRMEIVGTIRFAQEQSAREFFLDGDRVVVYGGAPMQMPPKDDWLVEREEATGKMVAPYYNPSAYGSFLSVYELGNRTKPTLVRTLTVEGNYTTARLIGHTAYAVVTMQRWYYGEQPEASPVPLYQDSISEGMMEVAPCDKVAIMPVPSNTFTTILALDLASKGAEASKEVLLGGAETVFASEKNLYVAATRWENAPQPWLPFMRQQYVEPKETTVIAKFSLDGLAVSYIATGEVPGTMLNQFSMDEYDGNLRVATTRGNVFDGSSESGLTIFDSSMERLSGMGDLGRGEKIYAVRFMGERGYVVTFKKVDPLYVLDLADPKNPSVLGELKIPGYSDYLHPYDSTHLIGVGKDAVDSGSGDFAWYQGVKMAIFDVSDVANPKQLHQAVIGDRGTDSPVLTDHRAFFFDRERNLLVLPVTVAEVLDEPAPVPMPDCPPGARCAVPPAPTIWDGGMPRYGQQTFNGAYVYNLTLADGFTKKGEIEHGGVNDWEKQIQRVLRIDETLYTLSQHALFAHSYRPDVRELGNVSLQPSAWDAPVEDSSDDDWVVD